LVFCINKSPRELWVIFFYILLSFSLDFFQYLTPWGQDNHFKIFSIFTIVEYALFTYFFYLIIVNKLIKRAILIVGSITVVILLIIFFRSEKTNFDSISASVESVTLIILSLVYFFSLVNKPNEHFLYASPQFWIVLAIMIYLSGTLFLFVMAHNLSPAEIKRYWFINNISNVITNIIFCIAFLVNRFVKREPLTGPGSYPEISNMPEDPTENNNPNPWIN